MKLLSICIPSFKDEEALEHNLDLLTEYDDFPLEVLICDDCPDSKIFSIVEKYQSKISINYFKGDGNSLDGALIKLIEKSSGDYVWWLGDDKLLPNSIDLIYKTLTKNKDLIFLWINSIGASSGDLTFNISKDEFFDNRDKLLEHDIGLLGFITATIFNRKAALPSIKMAKKHIGSSFACLYIIMYVLSVKGRLGMLSQPCFTSLEKPSGEVRWYQQYQVFGINLFDIIIQFDDVFSPNTQKKALSKNLLKVLRSVIYERAIGLQTGFGIPNISLKTLLLKYYGFLIFWIYFPLLLLPRKILTLLFKVHKLFLKK